MTEAIYICEGSELVDGGKGVRFEVPAVENVGADGTAPGRYFFACAATPPTASAGRTSTNAALPSRSAGGWSEGLLYP
mgnify:CR=1 FL=1